MTPFQAIRATIDMLLAKARAPIGARALIPAPLDARHEHSRTERSAESPLRSAQMRRRRSDSPVHRTSSLQRIWRAITEWVAHRHADANR
jgi:hypothetical protein